MKFDAKYLNDIYYSIIWWNSYYKFFNKILLYICKTPLYTAIENDSIKIIKLLLANSKLDINAFNILNQILLIK